MKPQHRFAVEPPEWYTEERAWADLEPAQRIMAGLRQKNIEALDQAITGAGYAVRGPVTARDNLAIAAAVLEYAARDREAIEIYSALNWLATTGRLIRLA